ncbi:sporulation integral membrane protein YtvI [Ruminococcus sp. AF14-10]|nr:sporulation integral membrane protein YtvI [Ruminococcus sp. AF14-10]
MQNRRPYWQVAVSLLFSLLATAAFVIVGVKVLALMFPFVVGWVIAMIASPLVNWLEKKFNIVKKLGSALVVILVLALIVLILYFSISKLVTETISLLENIPQLYKELEAGLDQIGNSLQGIFHRLPPQFQEGWDNILLNMDQKVGTFITKISEPTVAAAGNFAKKVPSFLISIIVAIMSAYLFTVEHEEVLVWAKKTAPPSVVKRMTLVSDNLKYAVGGYLKAQIKIMGIVFLILWVGLSLLQVHYAVLIAIAIAFLDFLPFFGTGTAMIPWALYKFLVGNIKMAVLLLIVYAITQLVRQLIQPRMLGKSMGLNPLVTLILLYLGYRLGGVTGMIVAVPFGMILINMTEAGAFDYILDDVNILVEGILGLREDDSKEKKKEE